MRRTGALFLFALVCIPGAAWPQGNPLGPEFRVNTYTTSSQRVPSAAADSSGNFVVVWLSYQPGDPDGGVFGQRYASSGSPLGPEFHVNTYTTNHQISPSVASDQSGNFVVVWSSWEWQYPLPPVSLGILGQRYASSGTPLGPEFRVNTYTASLCCPSVAADSSGNFVVVWNSPQDGSSEGVFSQRYDSSGTPLGPEFRVNTYTTSNQSRPSVASDTSGNFVVTWASQGQDGSSDGVFGQRYASSGASLGPEFRVNTYTTGREFQTSVAADSSGTFVVVWSSTQKDGFDRYSIFGQRYASSGAPLGPEFRVNTYTTGYQRLPDVASDSPGNFIVVWRSNGQDGSYYGAFGQRYASSGTPLGPEFRVNTYTTGRQDGPSVAAVSSGNFVVVWQSSGQDGSYDGVFGQRYAEIVPVELLRFTVE